MQNQRISREKSEEPEEDRRGKKKTHQIAYDQLKTPDEGIMPESDSLGGLMIDNHAALLSETRSYKQKANMVTQLQQSHGNTYVQRVMERIQAQEGLGQPLEVETRSKMEAAFNRDLSDVRIHSDDAADEITRNLDATALTSGTDVFFGEGRYQPGSESGRALLSHELTHVVQQENSRQTEPESIGQAGDVFEQEADWVSSAMSEGSEISIETASAVPALQRQMGEAVSEATEALPEAAEAARTQAFGALQEVTDGLLSQRPDFSAIIARIMEIVSTLRGAASSAMSRAGGFLGGLAGRAGSAIGGLAGRAGGAAGGMAGRARGLLGGLFG